MPTVPAAIRIPRHQTRQMFQQTAPVGAVKMIGLALGTQHKFCKPRNPLFYSEVTSSPKLVPPRRRLPGYELASRQATALHDGPGIIGEQHLGGILVTSRANDTVRFIQAWMAADRVMRVAGDDVDKSSTQQTQAGGFCRAAEAAQ